MPPAEQQKVIRYLCLLTIIIIILSQIARWFLFSCSLFVKSLCQSLPFSGVIIQIPKIACGHFSIGGILTPAKKVAISTTKKYLESENCSIINRLSG